MAGTPVPNDSILTVIHQWARDTWVAEEGHYNAAKQCRRWHSWLGAPTVAFTAFVASSAYLAMDDSGAANWRIVAAIVGAVAVVLSAIQTFAGLRDRAQSHKSAGAEFSCIRRELQVLTAREELVSDTEVADIRHKIDRITKESPEVPRNVWDDAKQWVSKQQL